MSVMHHLSLSRKLAASYNPVEIFSVEHLNYEVVAKLMAVLIAGKIFQGADILTYKTGNYIRIHKICMSCAEQPTMKTTDHCLNCYNELKRISRLPNRSSISVVRGISNQLAKSRPLREPMRGKRIHIGSDDDPPNFDGATDI